MSDVSNQLLRDIKTAETAATPAGAAVIGKVGIDHTTPGTTDAVVARGVYSVAGASPTYGAGQYANLEMSPHGAFKALLTGTVLAGADGVPTVMIQSARDDVDPATGVGWLGVIPLLFNGATMDRAPGNTSGAFVVAKPVATGGVSMARLVASAGANVKAGAGQLYGGIVTNSNAAIRYLHAYNKATAAVLGTDTPVATFPLPPNASVQITTDGLGAAFATGISWAFTTDNIAIPAAAGATTDLHGTLFFK